MFKNKNKNKDKAGKIETLIDRIGKLPLSSQVRPETIPGAGPFSGKPLSDKKAEEITYLLRFYPTIP